MDFESFLYIIVLFAITILISGSLIASQIARNSKGKSDMTSSLINALQTGDFASAFQNILTGVANKTIGTALVPIKSTMDTMIDTMGQINNNIHSGKKMVTQTRGFAFSAINDFVNQIFAVVGSVQNMIVRIMYLIKRVVAVFITIIYATRSSLAIGESFSNSVFGKILMFFCFSGDTKVELKSGSKRYISQLKIGDELKEDGFVTGIIRTSGRYISIFKIDNIKMSGEHYIFDEKDNLWKPAKHHSKAIPLSQKEKYLYNIETTKGTITLPNGLRCLDYDDDGIFSKFWEYLYQSPDLSAKINPDDLKQNPNNILLEYSYLHNDGNIVNDVLFYDETSKTFKWASGKPISSITNTTDFIDKMVSNNLLFAK